MSKITPPFHLKLGDLVEVRGIGLKKPLKYLVTAQYGPGGFTYCEMKSVKMGSAKRMTITINILAKTTTEK